MAAKLFALSCIRKESHGDLSPRPHYPSMPKIPRGASAEGEDAAGAAAEGSEARAVLSVVGMTCSACAGSVEKAVKRLPGIREAVIDVLNGRAQVLYYPSFVNVSVRHSDAKDLGYPARVLPFFFFGLCRFLIEHEIFWHCTGIVMSLGYVNEFLRRNFH